MKNKLLFNVAALAVAFGVSDLSARSLNTFNESDRTEIGAHSDRVNAVVEILGGSSTGKATPLVATDATEVKSFIEKAMANEQVQAFLLKELGSTPDQMQANFVAKVADTKASKELLVRFADTVANAAVKTDALRTVLDTKVAVLVEAKKTAAEREAEAKAKAAEAEAKAKAAEAEAKAKAEAEAKAKAEAEAKAKAEAEEIERRLAEEPSEAAKRVKSYDGLTPEEKAESARLSMAELDALERELGI